MFKFKRTSPLPQTPDPLVESLRAEILFLREQVKTLTEKLSPKPAPPAPVNPFVPKVFDESSKTFRPKTDEEINSDLRGLRELGIF